MYFSDPSFQFFLRVAWIIFVCAGIGIAIGIIIPRTREKTKAVWRAYWPWGVMLPVIFLSIGFGRKTLIISLLLLSIFGTKEYAKATGLYRDWGFMVLLYGAIAGIYAAAWIKWFNLFNAMPIYGISVLFLIPIIRNQYEGMIQKVALSSMALVYFGWFLSHLVFIECFYNGAALLLYLVIGVELNDAAAFLTGKFFGRRHLFSKISPNKTLEGSLGALVVTSIYTWAVAPWLGLNTTALILSVLIVWLGGTAGDLVISFIKRDIGVKDMGSLIPGHGGLLDRADSLIFVAPLYFHTLKFFIGNPVDFLQISS